MEEDNEAVALQREIEFLTNLINRADSQPKSQQRSHPPHHAIAPTGRHNTHRAPSSTLRYTLCNMDMKKNNKYSLTRPKSATLTAATSTVPFQLARTKSVPNTKILPGSYRLINPGSSSSNSSAGGSNSRTVQTTKQVNSSSVAASSKSSIQHSKLSSKASAAESISKNGHASSMRRVVKPPPKTTITTPSAPMALASSRTVFLPRTDITRVRDLAHKPKTLVRSASDTTLDSRPRMVLAAESKIKQSATSCTLIEKLQASVKKTNATATPATVSVRATLESGGGSTRSPTVIEAGKKIIEEIERLNKAMLQLEKSSRGYQVSATKPEASRQACSKSNASPKEKTVDRVVLPSRPKTKTPNPTLISNKECLVIDAATPSTIISHQVSTGSTPPVLQNVVKGDQGMTSFHKTKYNHNSGNNSTKTKRNPYKLVRSSGTLPITASSPTKSTPQRSVESRSCKRSLSNPVSTNSSKYKLTRLNSKGAKFSSKTDPTVPSVTPRRRVYLTRRCLKNKPANVSPATSSAAAIRQVPRKSEQRGPSASEQAGEVKALLQDLSFIDTALKTAKLQSSQKLLKRALLTKQRSVQRSVSENSQEGVSLTSRTSRLSQAKWRSYTTRTPKRGGHSRSKSPTKGRKSWNSRFSIKKSSPGCDLSINQLLGRTVNNVSSNKYKFISSDASDVSPQKNQHQTSPYSQRNKNRHKVDRRTPVKKRSTTTRQRLNSSRKLVSIGGVVYRSSSRKLTRASPKGRVVSRKGFPRPRTYSVSVGGHKYKVTQNGRSLLKVDNKKDGVHRISLGGIKYIQTRPGKLIRAMHTASQTSASRSIYRSIATSTAAARRKRLISGTKMYCIFYNRFGKCNRGAKCPYKHDPEKVAVCTRFLRGTCKVTDCPFSHKVVPEKMPVCTHFLRGVCVRDNCPYRHVKVSRDAELCQDFVNGYCPLADKCKKKHSRVCPKHDSIGGCPQGENCKLFHPRRGAKRPTESEERPAVRKPRTKLTDVRMEVLDEDDDQHLPLHRRRLPSFISIRSEESFMDDSTTATPGNFSMSYDEPLQIRPNLSFDIN